jgi:hypothetical protein
LGGRDAGDQQAFEANELDDTRGVEAAGAHGRDDVV